MKKILASCFMLVFMAGPAVGQEQHVAIPAQTISQLPDKPALQKLFADAEPISKKPSPIEFAVAMELGEIRQAKRWLQEGLDPNFLGDRIGSGIMIGAWEGNIPLMEVFLNAGADINKENTAGEQALLHAVWKGHRAAAEWLLQRGATVNRPALRWTPLHYAAFSGNQDLVSLLLEKGASLDATSPNGSTPMMMAIYGGHPNVARDLLKRGASARIKNDWGDGALEWAVKYNQLAFAKEVGEQKEYLQAVRRLASSWDPATNSAPRSVRIIDQMDQLLTTRRYMIAKGMPTDKLDRVIAEVHHKTIANAAPPPLPRSEPVKAVRMDTLEVTASRSQPWKQSAILVGDH